MSEIASDVDYAFWFITVVGVGILSFLLILMVVFVIRFHHSKGRPTKNISHNSALEITWTVVPTIMVMIMFVLGWTPFAASRDVSDAKYNVKVTGSMWSWDFVIEGDPQKRHNSEMYVPVNTKIKVSLHAPVNDVLHAFGVPAFRIKEDVIPNEGFRTYTSFTAIEEGKYKIYCTEYCGRKHSQMLSTVNVLSQEAFDSWYNGSQQAPGVDSVLLVKSKGCLGCHSTDGKKMVGPSFKGIFGRETKLKSGDTITANEEYLKRAINDPHEEVVEGFSDIMAPQNMADKDLKEIIEYLKNLR